MVVLLALGVIAWWGWDYWRERRFDQVILAAANRYQVDPALVKAVVWREAGLMPGRADGRANWA